MTHLIPSAAYPAVLCFRICDPHNLAGDVLFSGGADYRVHMFDLRARTILHTLCAHSGTIRALCFTQQRSYLSSHAAGPVQRRREEDAPPQSLLCSSGGDFNVCMWS